MTAPMVEDQPHYHRNGFYSHESLRKPHRIRVVDVGGLAVLGLLIAALLFAAVGLLLGALWMVRTFWDLLVGHA